MADPELLVEAIETFSLEVPGEGGGDYGALGYNVAHAGYLMVPRHGQTLTTTAELVSSRPDNEQAVTELGLPSGTEVIFATNNTVSAVVAAVYSSNYRDPLVLESDSHYGWSSGDVTPWVDEALRPTDDTADGPAHAALSVPLGRILFVDKSGFEPHPVMPDCFYKVDTGDTVAAESFDVSKAEILELAAKGLITWREHQTASA